MARRRQRRRRCEACGVLCGPEGHECSAALRISTEWRLTRLQSKADRLCAALDEAQENNP